VPDLVNWYSEGIPLGDWAEKAVEWIDSNLGFLLTFIYDVLELFYESLRDFLIDMPMWAVIVLFALITLVVARRLFLTIAVVLLLLLIDNLGLWDNAMLTVSLVLVGAVVALVIGIPTGILCSRSDPFNSVMKVVLDFMQTMPSFVYLIPAVILFHIGPVPGIIATVVFAVPPAVRLTNLGIRQVPKELNEVADSFGSNPWQKLFNVQLPVAMPTIMAGVNQCIMLALSMVVIASMIGAPGLGTDVLVALQRVQIGNGVEAGVSIVIIAIILDRITQGAGAK
jgi:glycine betaine/proline transport system permease protein